MYVYVCIYNIICDWLCKIPPYLQANYSQNFKITLCNLVCIVQTLQLSVQEFSSFILAQRN